MTKKRFSPEKGGQNKLQIERKKNKSRVHKTKFEFTPGALIEEIRYRPRIMNTVPRIRSLLTLLSFNFDFWSLIRVNDKNSNIKQEERKSSSCDHERRENNEKQGTQPLHSLHSGICLTRPRGKRLGLGPRNDVLWK